MTPPPRRSLLTTMDAQVDGERVRLTISRADSPELLSLLLTGGQARDLAQRLLHLGLQVSS